MLHKTNGIVLRSVKYGESSLVTTLFTSVFGIQSYMVQGVRSSKASRNRAGSFQPGVLLELVVYHQQQKNLQRISQFQAAYIYNGLQEDVIKNSIVIFSAELLLRLLPEQAPLPSLFDFVYEYLVSLDKTPVNQVANFPLYFTARCSQELGFDLKGSFSEATPYLDMQNGEFSANEPTMASPVTREDVAALSEILKAGDIDTLKQIHLNSATRLRLIDWYIAFLQLHTGHMGSLRSLPVLRMILH
jgi:DNA repair protein RecO (recombination protein O)